MLPSQRQVEQKKKNRIIESSMSTNGRVDHSYSVDTNAGAADFNNTLRTTVADVNTTTAVAVK